MTAPVDIAAVVRLARAMVAGTCSACCNSMPLARALIALADERATVEQRTAEAIAAWIEEREAKGTYEAGMVGLKLDGEFITAAISAGRWRTP